MNTLEKDLADLVRQWRTESREQHAAVKRLRGAEQACALTHANTKEAAANALQRVLVNHSTESGAKR
ncbi:hypothetical protein [Dyella lutea]|uniref:Uncharacterized protein n=1 Tax=Dyella lutea TaxID=2950441 RepID=A0ABT1FDC1_9GAMM|nr:hypothetical protein [Dyella lutea]MCP1375375.1 hypothetical protein [Dyella lutea]